MPQEVRGRRKIDILGRICKEMLTILKKKIVKEIGYVLRA